MLEFLVDNIFVVFGRKVFQHIVAIPMGTNFNFTYRYIDDVLSINNRDFQNYLDQMYPAEFEIKDTTESNSSASY